MSDDDGNLIENFFGPETEPQEYTQERIYSVEVRGLGWIDIKMGTFEVAFGDTETEVYWNAVTILGGETDGLLGDITGFKSWEIPVEDPETDG